MTEEIVLPRLVSQTAVQARANDDRLSRWYDWLAASEVKAGGGTAVRLYEWCHAHWPAVIDCRPIRLLDGLQTARFSPVQVRRMSMRWGHRIKTHAVWL
ncbi:MAG: hypothetical protein IPF56_08190 [Chloroflexi bacterium]|nr:hypothetical protein [Chloroflexota bacterium]MBK6709207.1 hypothetical protein [Chloroflexota bacterium]